MSSDAKRYLHVQYDAFLGFITATSHTTYDMKCMHTSLNACINDCDQLNTLHLTHSAQTQGRKYSLSLLSCQRCRFAELDENVSSRALFWTAPEHLQKHFLAPTEHSDVYRYNNDLFTQSCICSRVAAAFALTVSGTMMYCDTHTMLLSLDSLGVIITEIFTREDPFDELSNVMEPKEIVEKVMTQHLA